MELGDKIFMGTMICLVGAIRIEMWTARGKVFPHWSCRGDIYHIYIPEGSICYGYDVDVRR